MAIKERKYTGRTLESAESCVGASQKSGPHTLTAEESASLFQSLAKSPEPLSPEVKRAIANYKRIKAARVR